MRLIIYILLFINLPLWGQQNLVPNASFEVLDSCPSNINEICLASPWFQAIECWPSGVCNCGSTNIFNTCMDPSLGLGGNVPSNVAGYQHPYEGNGYSGIGVLSEQFGTPNDLWREYLEVKLNNQLEANRQYCVKWYSSLGNVSRFGTNSIGAYFSNDTIFQTGNQYDYINVNPQIEDQGINVDTANWSLFYQTFLAQGDEQFMTIGNFKPGLLTDTSELINPDWPWAFYYMDNFGVYLLPQVEAGLSDSIYGYETTILNGSCVDCWNGLQFTWQPSEDFEDPHSLTAQVSPDVTTTYYLTVQDTTGTVPCMDEVRDSVTIYVKNGPDFIVFPNPSIQDAPVKVYIGNVGGGSLTIRVHDIKGKLIYEKLDVKSLSTHELDLKLSAGMYTVTLNSEIKIVETKKLVIEE